jgi:hypothetical protein
MITRTVIARCDRQGCLAEVTFDGNSQDGLRVFLALTQRGWTTPVEQAEDPDEPPRQATYCPDHPSEE